MVESTQAESLLRHSEARFRAIFESAGIGILLLDVQGNIVEANPAVAAMIGRSGTDLTGGHFRDLIHSDDAGRVWPSSRDLLEGKLDQCEADAIVVRSDGSGIPARITSTLVRDDNGRAAWGFVILEDVSERRNAAEALRRSEEKYAGIVEIAAEAIVSIDSQRRIVQFNRAAERIFGWSADEVAGRRIEVLMPERFRRKHRDHVRRFAASPDASRVRGHPVTALTRDGQELNADVSISAFGVNGQRYFTAVLHDITDRVRRDAEHRLLADAGEVLTSTLDYSQTLRNIARLVARHLGDWCAIDVAAEDGSIRRLATATSKPDLEGRMQTLLRYPPTPDRPHVALKVWRTHKPTLLSAIDPAMLARLAVDDEHAELLHALDPRSVMAVPLMARDRLLGVMIAVTGPDRRAFDERDLALASDLGHRAAIAIDNARLFEAAQESARARQRVLGIVAHDLRSPLNGIMMASDMLLHYLERDPNPAHRRPAQAILREADRMNRLIQDLLDVRAIEAGHLSVELLPMPPRALVEDALALFREPAAAAGIDLQTDLADGLPRVMADRGRIVQVFSNLIDNAIKYTPTDGSVSVSAWLDDDLVRFSVSDTGPGIAEEHRERIFAPFWRGAAGNRRGVGLGLSIARGIIAAHGSRLEVDSAPGRGTMFTFTLRCQAPVPDRNPAVSERP